MAKRCLANYEDIKNFASEFYINNTFHYVGHFYDYKIDVWGIGCVLF